LQKLILQNLTFLETQTSIPKNLGESPQPQKFLVINHKKLLVITRDTMCQI